MQRIRRTAVAVALSSVVLSLAACSEDEPGPKAAEEPTAVETTPAAEQETPEEFIRRWFKASEDMQNTGDTAEYLAMAPECPSCKKLANRVTEYYADGGWIKFKGSTLGTIENYENTENRFLVPVDSGSTEYRTSKTAQTESFQGGKVEFIVTLEPVGDDWQVLEMHQLAS